MNATETETPKTSVEVGDFFYTSWGYDQTNVDFYKVVGLTPSGKSVRVQKWTSALVGEPGSTEYVVPGGAPATYEDWSEVDQSADYWTQREQVKTVDAPVVTKRLKTGGYKDFSFYVNSYSNAYLWDGKPQMKTGAGWGH